MNRPTKRMLQRQGDQPDVGAPPGGGGEQPPRRPPPGEGSSGGRGGGGRRSTPVTYVREVRSELRRVAWPSREDVVNYSAVVVVTLILLVGLIFALNLAFGRAISALFGT